MFRHLPFAQYAHVEAPVVAVVFGHPLGSRFRVNVSVVFNADALVVQADAETIVKPSHVQIGLVLHTPLLGRGAKGRGRKQGEQGKRPMGKWFHHKHITRGGLNYCA